jgi:hypothetical protein
LSKAGAVVGRKAEQDYHIPDMIKYGYYSIKNAYFDQAIKHDGNRDYRKYIIRISAAQEIESKASPEDRRVLLDNITWDTKSR